MSEQIAAGLSSASVSVSSSGDNTVIAAQSGKVIAVHRVVLASASAVTLQFKDGTTALSGAMTANSLVLDYNDDPYYRTSAGSALVLSLGSSVQTGGTIWYRAV